MGASIWDDDPKLGWFIIGLPTGLTTLLMVDLSDVHFLSKLVIEQNLVIMVDCQIPRIPHPHSGQHSDQKSGM
jgi:hypothetical protein